MIRRPMKTAALVASMASIMSAVGTGSARSQGTAAEATPAAPMTMRDESTPESTEWAPLVVDTHAHVWNAQDLAVAGFVSKVTLNADEMDPWRYVKRPYLVLLDFPYTHLFAFWKLPGDFVRFSLKSGQWIANAIPKPVKHYLTSSRWTYDKEIEQLDRLLYQRQYERRHRPLERKQSRWRQTTRAAASGAVEYVAKPIWCLPNELIVKPTGVRTWFEAIKRNRESRFSNAQQLMGIYARVDAFVTALVDFDYWLDDEAETTIEEQVDLLSAISILAEGRILPFVGYDPRRNIEENGRAFRNVETAILEKGFVGIKLYPPMGFRALGNAGLDVAQFKKEIKGIPGEKRLEFGEQLDADLKQLYAWAERNEVPIMAHGSESNGPSNRTQRRASPGHWAAVAEQFPELRVNIGHFGGADDLLGEARLFRRDTPPKKPWDIDNWTFRIISLIEELGPGGNVYADTAMFDELLESGAAADYFKKLREELAPRSMVSQRLLYGSDWMMLALSFDHPEYLDRLREGYEQELPETLDLYMGGNASRYLGLGRDRKARTRLDAFYAANDVNPVWRCKVDGLAPHECPNEEPRALANADSEAPLKICDIQIGR